MHLFLQPLNTELLKRADLNVINVDWGGFLGSKTLYTQATANTRIVAAEIAYLVNQLKVSQSIMHECSENLVVNWGLLSHAKILPISNLISVTS